MVVTNNPTGLSSRVPSSSETLLRPQTRARPATGQTRGLSTEIIGQSARRLRILALVYAFVFFMSAFMGNLFFAEARAEMLANPGYWLPDILSIAMALLVAALTLTKKVPLSLVMNFGLAFLVTSNYGIAISEFINPERLDRFGWVGLSWVAVWTPLYSVAVPTPPRKALAAMLASVSAVPVMVGYMILAEKTVIRLGPLEFFFAFVFPYLLVVVLGYVGAHVVYDLGKEVTRAQDLGSYHLVERLGQGGMGEVWRAQHRLLARPAAIKLIRRSLIETSGDAGGVLRRFEREAQVTAQLRSPHTVELFDFGVADDGAFYYVMELLEGMDLEALVNRYGPVPAERAIHLLRQVCHSLAEAESKGLVHRDIKPSNIFACVYGGDHDFVKVLDFGIVKATDTSNLDTGVRATSTMLLQGTPAFIAPEQALGGGAIDGRADIYATGCVAYWLLTGQLVFSADTAMGTIMHHARTAPTPPSQRSELAIPPDLDALVMACLAKDPADRPQSAGELSRRLAGVACGSDWSDERARDWWSAHHPAAAT
jgi:eukaryotic-like serine/threonine-protein kinase